MMKSFRYRLKKAHEELVRGGEFGTARIILLLLRHGRVMIGLSDEDYKAECLLDRLKVRKSYSHNFYAVNYYI